jgi:hypothetical protein
MWQVAVMARVLGLHLECFVFTLLLTNQNVTNLAIFNTLHLHVTQILNKTQQHVMVSYCYTVCAFVTSTLMTFSTTKCFTRLPRTRHCDRAFSFQRNAIKHAATILVAGNPFFFMPE